MPVKVRYTNPFPGLSSFESQDSELFFGRESHIAELRKKLSSTRFLAIVASSGSGKSSMIKAGLIPSLQKEKLTGTLADEWRIVLFKPGASPIGNLLGALQKEINSLGQEYPDLEKAVKENPRLLGQIFQTIHDRNILLVIDQFEEVFRYREDETSETGQDETALLIGIIMDILQQQTCPVYVVLTMRSDYLDACTYYPGFTEAINRGYYLLPKMNNDEIRRAIVMPIQLRGATITPTLLERLLGEVERSYDSLPILQHALMRTWNHWESQNRSEPIDVIHYEAVGTMQEAISRHAEEIYHDLPGNNSRLAVQKIFTSLIVLAPGDIGVMRPTLLRRMVRETGLPEEQLTDIINRFRERGTAFLTPSYSQRIDQHSFIDISMERITVLWDRLHKWIEEETESAKLYKKLAVSAQLYQAGKTGLLVNPELQIALKWLKETNPTKEWAEKYDPYFERVINYIDHSRIESENRIKNNENKQKRELKRARYFAIVMGLGSLMSLLFLVISLVLRYDAEQSRKQSLEKEKVATAERARAESQTRESYSQKRIAEQQETIAEQQRRLTEEQRSIAVREQQLAEIKRIEAEIAKQVAIIEKVKADSAQKLAERQKDLAVKARAIADSLRFQADLSRRDAQISQKDAEEQRGKAIARSIAIQSYQMAENSQDVLPALLAAQAYRFNIRNGGQKDNPDIFRALSKATDTRTILRWHRDVVRTVVRRPGGESFASAGDDGTVKVWGADLNAQPAVQTFDTQQKRPASLRSLAFTADGSRLFAGSAEGHLYVWDAMLPSALPRLIRAHQGVINSVLINKTSDRLVSVSGDGTIRTWKITASGLDSLQSIKTGVDLFCARLTPDGRQLACGASKGRVLLLDINDLRKEPASFNYYGFGNRVTALAFDPSGTHLITANSAGSLYQWNFNDNKIDRIGLPLSGRHTSPVSEIIFSPDGSMMATCSYDWTVHLWSYESISNRQIQPIVIDDFDTWVLGIAFSKDSKNLVAGGADRTLRVWSINPEDLYRQVVQKIDRDMTVDEWNRFVGKEIPYEKAVKREVQ
jgi:WD40 repeat protein